MPDIKVNAGGAGVKVTVATGPRGPQGDPGPQGLPGPNSVPTDVAVAALVNTPGTDTADALSATFADAQGVTLAVPAGASSADVQTILTAAPAGSRVVFSPGTYAAPTNGWTVGNDGVQIDASRATLTQSTWQRPIIDLNARDGVKVDIGVAEFVGTRSGAGSSYRGSAGYVSTAAVWANGDRNDIRVRRSIDLVCAVFLSAWAGTGTYDHQGVGNRVRIDEAEGFNFALLWSWQKDLVVDFIYGHDDIDDSSGANPTHVIYGSADATHRDENVTVKGGRGENIVGGHAFQIKHSDRATIGTLTAHNCGGLMSVMTCHDLDWAGGTITESLATPSGIGSVAFHGTESQRPKVGPVSVKLASGLDERGALLISADGDYQSVKVVSDHSVSASTATADINIRGPRNRVTPINEQLGTAIRGVMVGISGAPADDTMISRPVVVGATKMVNVVGGSTGVVVDYDPLAQSVTAFVDTVSGTGAEGVSSRSAQAAALTTFGELSALAFFAASGTPTVGAANSALQRKVRPTRDITVTGLRWWSVTPSGNYDIGIIDDATNVRMWSKGSTAWPAGGVVNEMVTGVTLRAGRTYRIAFSADNGTGTLRGIQAAIAGLDVNLDGSTDTTTVSSAFPLPDPLVAGSSASTTRVPLIAVLG